MGALGPSGSLPCSSRPSASSSQMSLGHGGGLVGSSPKTEMGLGKDILSNPSQPLGSLFGARVSPFSGLCLQTICCTSSELLPGARQTLPLLSESHWGPSGADRHHGPLTGRLPPTPTEMESGVGCRETCVEDAQTCC